MAVNIGGGCIIAKSTKQKIVTKSSTEAELVGLSDHAGVGIELGKMIHNQMTGGIDPDATITVILLQDNMSTISMIHNGRPNSDSSRHVSLRNFWLSDQIKSGNISIQHCPTVDMTADLLTKPLQGHTLHKLRNKILSGALNKIE
jgi:hypothetical protein